MSADTPSSTHVILSHLDRLGEGILIVDCDWRVVYVNPEAARLVRHIWGGMPLRVGAMLWERVPALADHWIGTDLRRAAEERVALVREVSAPGGVDWIEIRADPGDDGVALLIRDVTERRDQSPRRAEEYLRRAQKMEAVGRLAGGVAHDFNNMLMIIMGFSDFLAASLAEDDERRADAEEIRNAAERAATLTRQLLSFGRQQVLRREIVDLNSVVLGLERMLRPILGEAIRVVTRLAPRLGGVVADPSQMEQVLTNLVLNARDAMPTGGHLDLETAEREFVDGEAHREVGVDLPPGHYVLLSVSDSGQGMDAAVRSRLFEPFFTTKPPAQNTGLGLAMVYGIVTQFGGSIWVDSEPGHGSRFTVCFPRVAELATFDTPAATPPPRGGDETILVVEDEEAVRSLACRVLVEQGYRVVAAANGREALEAIAQPGPAVDLVLSDLVMPEMGGAELADRIEALLPGTPMLFMSGYAEREHRVGAAGPVLEKPFAPERLARQVRQALDDHGHGSQYGHPDGRIM